MYDFGVGDEAVEVMAETHRPREDCWLWGTLRVAGAVYCSLSMTSSSVVRSDTRWVGTLHQAATDGSLDACKVRIERDEVRRNRWKAAMYLQPGKIGPGAVLEGGRRLRRAGVGVLPS